MIKRYKKYVHNSEDKEEEELITIPQHKEEVIEEETKERVVESKERSIRYCDLCKRKLISEKDYLFHIQGKKHLNKIKEVTFQELKIVGSVRKYLKYKQLLSKIKNSPLNKARVILYTHLLKKMLKKLPVNK